MPVRLLVWEDGSVRFLDQTFLPETEHEIVTQTARRNSSIAPFIFESAVISAIDLIASTRPAAGNLFRVLKRQQESLTRTSGLSALHRSEILLTETSSTHRGVIHPPDDSSLHEFFRGEQ
jgi:methylthioribose-1-phosphate isomerase